MSYPDAVIDWLALAIGAAGIVVAIVALVRTRATTRSAAMAATDSRAAAEESAASADAAQRSADAAEHAAAAAAETERLSREHQHELLRPDPAVDIELEAVPDQHHGEQFSLVGSITVPRDYRVYGEAIGAAVRSSLNLPALLRSNRPYRFEIDTWRSDGDEPRTQELRLLFWPPDEGDENGEVEAWVCPCDRDAAYGDLDSPHWEWRAPVPHDTQTTDPR